jgi:NAD dependent epimerase/dehydratase family enzyme
VRRLIVDDRLAGPVNICAPNPLTNWQFMRELRHACGVRIGLPAAPWMLEIGARLMQTETELILKSRYVVPRRLLEAGFQFAYPTWDEAVSDLCRRSL